VKGIPFLFGLCKRPGKGEELGSPQSESGGGKGFQRRGGKNSVRTSGKRDYLEKIVYEYVIGNTDIGKEESLSLHKGSKLTQETIELVGRRVLPGGGGEFDTKNRRKERSFTC